MSEPMTWAAKDAPTADPYEHAVLTVLAQSGDYEDGANCGISHATLAERAKMSDREARACVQALRDRGLIGYGNQEAVAKIRGDRRPVVYDLLIPHDWYSPTQLARVNRWREERGRPPLSADQCGTECERASTATGPRCGHRPPLAPPPPKRRRADLGTKRRRNGGTTSPVVDGGTNSPPVSEVPTTGTGGLANSHGWTGKSSDVQLSPQVTAISPPHGGTASPTTFLDRKELTSLSVSDTKPPAIPAAAENPEREIPSEPQTPKSQGQAVDALVAEALGLHPGWAPRMVRKAIVEELGDGRPFEKVAAAWRACIVAPSAGPPSPGRFKHAGPWWDAAYGLPSVTNAPSPRTAAIAECPRCDPSGWVLDRVPAERCDHRTPAKVGAA